MGSSVPPQFQPQTIGGLVESGFSVLGRCYWKLLPLAAVTSGVTFVATWIIARSALVDGSFVEEKIVKAPAGSGFWPEYGASVATIGLLIVMYLVGTAVLMPATIPAAAGYRITRIPWSSAARVLAPALAVGILTMVIGAIGLVLLVVPGIWLLVNYSVAQAALVAEGHHGYAALRRSRSLVSGRWWATFGLLVVVSILTGIASLVPLRIAEARVDSAETIILLDSLIGFLTTTLTTPYVAAVTAALYIDLRARKETIDADSFAQMVTTADPGVGPTAAKPG